LNYQRLYEYRFRNVDQDKRDAIWQTISEYVYERMGRPERVLDPAAGRGEFINSISASERWAVDMVDYEEGTYDEDVKVVVSDIFDAKLPEAHFDGVWISNFLEHLLSQDQTALFLEKMHASMVPGGRIAIIGPNVRHCPKQYYDMADHTLIYSHKAIEEHVYAAGFEPILVKSQFLPYSFTGRLPAYPALTKAYLGFPPAWRLLGKQFLVIGQR
jgi:2-polyprenyl-3-methyl-5-hydroxy-6-metoxy-1,4-benzoquinol methylase